MHSAILAQAFLGELVPQDPNDEPVSVLLERIRAERASAGGAKRTSTRRGAPKTTAAEPEEPEATAPPPAPSQTEPAQSELPFELAFLDLDLDLDELAHALAAALFGAGPLSKGEAVRLADGLREAGLSDHKRLRTGGKLHTALEKAVKLGLLDGPFEAASER